MFILLLTIDTRSGCSGFDPPVSFLGPIPQLGPVGEGGMLLACFPSMSFELPGMACALPGVEASGALDGEFDGVAAGAGSLVDVFWRFDCSRGEMRGAGGSRSCGFGGIVVGSSLHPNF